MTKTKDATIIIVDTDYKNSIPELQDSIQEYCKINAEIKALEAIKETLKDDIFTAAEKSGYEGKSFLNSATGEIVQTVYSTTTKIDDDKVRKVVTPEMFDRITTRKVVPDLLRASIKMGEIVAREVADAFQETPVRRIYVRLPPKS
jgi:hypothetical protein